MISFKYKLEIPEFEICLTDDEIYELNLNDGGEIDDYLEEQIQEYILDNYKKYLTGIKN